MNDYVTLNPTFNGYQNEYSIAASSYANSYDSDTCDDCSMSHYDTSDDGDGQCDAGDCDDNNNGCQECWDYCP